MSARKLKRRPTTADADPARARDELGDVLACLLDELRVFYPHLTSAAVVLTPGVDLPAVVIPVTPWNVPNCIKGEWESYRTHGHPA